MKKGKQSKTKKTRIKVVKLLVLKAGVAVKNEFYLEALIIISQIMETRLRTIITRVEKAHPGSAFNLSQSVKRGKYLLLNVNDSILNKNFEVRLLDDIRSWKNQRNAILKDIQTIHVSQKRLKKMAEEGIQLLNELNASYKKFKSDWNKSLMISYKPINQPIEVLAGSHE